MLQRRFRQSIYALLVTALLLTTPLTGLAGNPADPDQKPTAVGDGGAVATEHPEASKAAITILENGGNAIDAAVAAAAVQGVTRPYSGGIGGGGIMHVYLEEEDRFVILDHRSESSENFGPDAFLDSETRLIYPESTRISSGMATAVPGAVKAWEKALQEYGTMSLSDVLQPAIKVAEEGFVADENFIRETSENADRFRLFESTREVYLSENGAVPRPGTVMKNPDLAKTYRLIAEHGSDIFYEGEIAEAIIDTIHNPPVIENPEREVLSGNMTMDDLRDYEVITREPTHVNYRGYDVYSTPPSSSGGVTIGETLNILEPYNIKDLPRAEALHYYMEASRYAFADRREFLGDPEYTANPVTGLLSKGYAAERRQNIEDDRASVGQVAPGNPWPYEENPDKQPDPPSKEDPAFYYNFSGSDGEAWDSAAFYRLDTGPRSSPDDAAFSLEHNTGKVVINERKEGRGSAYGRAASDMRPLEDSELLVRFRIDELGNDQRIRFWLQSDVWGSGSTMPANGYGIEFNAETGTLLLRGRKDSSSTIFDSIHMDVSTDWHWLRFRAHGDQLTARLWSDEESEPTGWDIVHHLSENEQLSNHYGKMLLSFINFEYDSGNTIYLDEITVNDLSDKPVDPIEPGEPDEGSFVYHFDGHIGEPWDRTKFDTIDEGVAFDLDDNGGRMAFNHPPGNYSTSYGKAAPIMEELENSELVMRFRMSDPGEDRRIRLWVRADDWRSTRSTFANNAYGIEINTKDHILVLKHMENGSNSDLASIDHTWTDEWMYLKLRVEDDQLKVRLWQDGENEPEAWDIEVTDNKISGAGKTLIGIHDLAPTGEGHFHISEITISDLDAQGVEWVEEEVDPSEDENTADESTIHLSVSDRDGNIVSYTTTIVSIGGNGMVVPGYGFLLNNALYGRTPYQSPDHPNYPKPRYRSLSSMAPTIVMKDGKPVMTAGAPGSDTIITTVLQIMINHLDFGMTLPEAIAAPRLTQRNNIDAKAEYEEIYLSEYGSLLDELEAMGHTFKPDSRVQGIGAATGLEFLSDGRVRAAAEPTRRGGGSAMAIDLGDIEDPPPSEDASVANMLTLVEQFADEGEITNNQAARLLQTHLTAVGHYEVKRSMDKAVKHMEGFKRLLDHQRNSALISDEAHQVLYADAESLIEKWQSTPDTPL